MKNVELCRTRRFARAPRVRKVERTRRIERPRVHAAAVASRDTRTGDHAPDVAVRGCWAPGQVEHAVLLVAEPGVQRIPLDPRLQMLCIVDTGRRTENVRVVEE